MRGDMLLGGLMGGGRNMFVGIGRLSRGGRRVIGGRMMGGLID